MGGFLAVVDPVRALAQCAPSVSLGSICRHLSEIGAVCGKAACTDLCGGRRVTAVPTATRVGTPADACMVAVLGLFQDSTAGEVCPAQERRTKGVHISEICSNPLNSAQNSRSLNPMAARQLLSIQSNAPKGENPKILLSVPTLSQSLQVATEMVGEHFGVSFWMRLEDCVHGRAEFFVS